MIYDLADMTSPEAAEAVARSRTAVLPIGSVEQHGPHLPNGTDTFAAELVAREVADRGDLQGAGCTWTSTCSTPGTCPRSTVPFPTAWHHVLALPRTGAGRGGRAAFVTLGTVFLHRVGVAASRGGAVGAAGRCSRRRWSWGGCRCGLLSRWSGRWPVRAGRAPSRC